MDDLEFQIDVEALLQVDDYSIQDAETIRAIILYGLKKEGVNELYIKIDPAYNFHHNND